jgi:predicted Zn finger-like uncharacterized protein
MPITATCPHCQTAHRLADTLRGKKVRCKQCGLVIHVEGPISMDGRASDQIVEGELLAPPAQAVPAALEAQPPRLRRSETGGESAPGRPRRQQASSFLVWTALIMLGIMVLGAVGLGFGAYFLFINSADDSGSWPAPAPFGRYGGSAFTAQQTVTVRVSGTADKYTYEAVMTGLMSIGGVGISGARDGDRATFLLAPVSDPDAYAKRIACGTVQSIRGRIITIVANKAEQPAASDPISIAIFELKSERLRFEALRQLKTMQPVEQRRPEVMKALRELPRNFTGDLGEAVANWAGTEDVPMLVEILVKRHREDFGHKPIIRALARLKDDRALDVLVDCLTEFFDREDAAGALKAFGAAAEKAVVKQLHHHDGQVQKLVCSILATIGTEASIASLEVVAASRERSAADAAKTAIQAIRARKP